MVVRAIIYHESFKKDLKRLSPELQARAVKTERLFRGNPMHPSLRTHPLGGRFSPSWSISVNMKIRIIFTRMPDGTIMFLSVGSHDIYR